jgi:hypothetical protein
MDAVAWPREMCARLLWGYGSGSGSGCGRRGCDQDEGGLAFEASVGGGAPHDAACLGAAAYSEVHGDIDDHADLPLVGNTASGEGVLIGVGGALDAAHSDRQGRVGERGSLAHSGGGVGWTEQGDQGCFEGGGMLMVALCTVEDQMHGGSRSCFRAMFDLRDVAFDECAEAKVATVAGPRSYHTCLNAGSDFGAGDVERHGEVGEERLNGWSGCRLRVRGGREAQ